MRRGQLCMEITAIAVIAAFAVLPSLADPGEAPPTCPTGYAVNSLIQEDEGSFRLHHRSHTVRFDDEGVTLSPRFGGPEWRWSFNGATTTDGKTLSPVQAGKVIPTAVDGAILYDRGSLIERYRALPERLEQEFIIPRPLSRPGADLAIHGLVRADARFQGAEGAAAWTSGEGAVDLSRLRVFDANGVQLVASLHTSARETRIVVSGASLDKATYPVIVDPEIGVNDRRLSDMGTNGVSVYRADFPSTAYNATDNEYLVVWHGDDTLDEKYHVFGQRLTPDGIETGTNDFRISFMGPEADPIYDVSAPDVAWNSQDNQYLVVWAADNPPLPDNDFEIYGQLLGADGSLIGGNFKLSDIGPADGFQYRADLPAVTYNATDNEYLVVWKADDVTDGEDEIHGQRISSTGTQLGINDFRISSMGFDGLTVTDAVDPDVTWSSVDNVYLVVWSGDDASGEDEIYGQYLSNVGAEQGIDDFRISETGTDGDTARDAGQPSVAYNADQNQFLVVWTSTHSAPGEFDIHSQLIAGTTGPTGSDVRLSFMGPDGSTNFAALTPAVVYRGPDYLVVWSADHDGPGIDDEVEIWGTEVESTAGNPVGPLLRFSDAGTEGATFFGATVPALSYNPSFDEVLVTWTADDDVGGMINDEYEIFGQLWGDLVPPDGDGDGVRDSLDICPGFDDAPDADGDTVPDGCDLCPGSDDNLDADGDGVTACAGDCDDLDPGNFPGNPEVCNNLDDDCDGNADNGLDPDADGICADVDNCPATSNPGQGDSDSDGTGDACDPCDAGTSSVDGFGPCSPCSPGTYASSPGATTCIACGDCDDTDICTVDGCDPVLGCTNTPTGPDADGDGTCDAGDNCPGLSNASQADTDGDGQGDACDLCPADSGNDADGDGECISEGDCNDSAADVNTGAPEICDNVDNDCDTQIDEGVLGTFYTDLDADGFGDPATATSACTAPPGTITDGTDCNDASAVSYPGATEACDGLDNDCDGTPPVDETDDDGDGFAECDGDCDDTEALIFPSAVELCDLVDNNCDGNIDEGFDADSDTVVDCADNCTADANLDQADFDGDGYGDACEAGVMLADMNLSGLVDGFDLAALARVFSLGCADTGYDAEADLDRNCTVDGNDLALFAPHFAQANPLP